MPKRSRRAKYAAPLKNTAPLEPIEGAWVANFNRGFTNQTHCNGVVVSQNVVVTVPACLDNPPVVLHVENKARAYRVTSRAQHLVWLRLSENLPLEVVARVTAADPAATRFVEVHPSGALVTRNRVECPWLTANPAQFCAESVTRVGARLGAPLLLVTGQVVALATHGGEAELVRGFTAVLFADVSTEPRSYTGLLLGLAVLVVPLLVVLYLRRAKDK